MQRMHDVEELDETDMKSAIVKSVIAHVIFVLFLTVRAYFFTGEPLQLESAIRVDIVGLPEKSATLPLPIEEPKADAPAKPVEAPAPTTKELPPKPARSKPPSA